MSSREHGEFIGGGATLDVDVRFGVDDTVLVTPRGAIDRETGPRLASGVRQAFADGAVRVELDMSQVSFIDSQGLRTLFEVAAAGDVRIDDPSPQVASLLRMTGVAEHFGLGDP